MGLDRPECSVDFVLRGESFVVPCRMVQLVQELEDLDLAGQGINRTLDGVKDELAQGFGGNILEKMEKIYIIYTIEKMNLGVGNIVGSVH